MLSPPTLALPGPATYWTPSPLMKLCGCENVIVSFEPFTQVCVLAEQVWPSNPAPSEKLFGSTLAPL